MQAKRKGIGKKVRFDVFKRDGFKCQYCGAHPPGVLLHIDHINPVADGGTNAIDNLITSCEPCNLGKGARPLTDIPPTLAQKAEIAAEREAQIVGYNKILATSAKRIDSESWDVADIWMAWHGKDSIRKDFRQSIKSFLAKLPKQEVLDAMERAVFRVSGQDASFRYFCGICWAKVREIDS